VAAGWGCARAPAPGAATPADIPALVAAVRRDSTRAGPRFRLAAALSAAGRCDSAVLVAGEGQALEPDNAVGPLVVGGCQERAERYDDAVATYREFVARHPRARGAAAVAAKAQLALRTVAERTARRALEHEAELAQQPPDARTVAVLPVVVAGDSTYRPLSRGLAELITTDLAYIRDLRLVERLHVGALLDELRLAESERVDPATAARVGRLLRAGRMVQGVVTLAPGAGGAPAAALAASVVGETGVVRPVGEARGPFRRLLDLEKQVVFDLADQFGIALTEAERERIRRRGPTSVLALLAYGRGLEALDRGDYGAAARHFGAALRAEPGFAAARAARDAAIAAPVAAAVPGERPAALIAAVERALAAAEPGGGPADVLLDAAGRDIVPALGDAVAALGGASSGTSVLGRDLTAEALGVPSIVSVVNGITIIFKRPP
jgi:tetratricopeptide (TPR) repeat protein